MQRRHRSPTRLDAFHNTENIPHARILLHVPNSLPSPSRFVARQAPHINPHMGIASHRIAFRYKLPTSTTRTRSCSRSSGAPTSIHSRRASSSLTNAPKTINHSHIPPMQFVLVIFYISSQSVH